MRLIMFLGILRAISDPNLSETVRAVFNKQIKSNLFWPERGHDFNNFVKNSFLASILGKFSRKFVAIFVVIGPSRELRGL